MRLYSTEFRSQHRRILPLEFYIKSIIWILSQRGLVYVCFHMDANCYDLNWFTFYLLYNMTKTFLLAYPFICVCFLVWCFFLPWSPNPLCEKSWRFLGIIQMVVMLPCFGHGSWCYFEQLLSYHFYFYFLTSSSMSTLKLSLWQYFVS